MIMIVFLLQKRANVSRDKFENWWLNEHAPHVCLDQAPYLRRYLIGKRSELDPPEPVGLATDDNAWDGLAIQFFESETDFRAVYERPLATTEATRRYVKQIKRIVLDPVEIDVRTGLEERSIIPAGRDSEA